MLLTIDENRLIQDLRPLVLELMNNNGNNIVSSIDDTVLVGFSDLCIRETDRCVLNSYLGKFIGDYFKVSFSDVAIIGDKLSLILDLDDPKCSRTPHMLWCKNIHITIASVISKDIRLNSCSLKKFSSISHIKIKSFLF